MKDTFYSEFEQTNIIIPSSPEDRKAIKAVLVDISNQMTIIESCRESNNEAIKELAKKYELPVKFVRKMAIVYHKQIFEAEKDESNDFQILYESIVES